MRFTDLTQGDTVVNRNGSTLIVECFQEVIPSQKTEGNNVLISFTDGSHGYYTEDLRLNAHLDSPLDIVRIV